MSKEFFEVGDEVFVVHTHLPKLGHQPPMISLARGLCRRKITKITREAPLRQEFTVQGFAHLCFWQQEARSYKGQKFRDHVADLFDTDLWATRDGLTAIPFEFSENGRLAEIFDNQNHIMRAAAMTDAAVQVLSDRKYSLTTEQVVRLVDLANEISHQKPKL